MKKLLIRLIPDAIYEALEKTALHSERSLGNDANLLIVFYIQIMPDDFVMQLHRF